MTYSDYFKELTKIPRSSGSESAAVEYIAAFACKYGLEYYIDKHNNILVKKNNNSNNTVLLQGHTDMVCQKDDGVEINFSKDPLVIFVDGDYLKAKGTSLGADDGIAVAYMLDLLTNEYPGMPNLECLFTSDEEQGMTGADNFDYSLISARSMINLDSEDEGVCICGCAGGSRVCYSADFDLIPEFNKVYSLELSNLAGGHSGSDIDKGLQNSTVMLNSLLCRMYDVEPFNLISFVSGDKDNAIPRSAKAVFTAFDIEKYKPIIENFINEKRSTVAKAERKFKLHLNKHRHIGQMLSFADTHRVFNLISLISNGVIDRDTLVDNSVRTSSNIGIFNLENGKLNAVSLIRSSLNSAIDEEILKCKNIAKLLNFSFCQKGRYPSWKFNEKSKLRKLYSDCYFEQYEKKPELEVIHAGLECGIVYSAIPDMDIISIGPQIDFIHSPRERLSISSSERTFSLLLKILKKIN